MMHILKDCQITLWGSIWLGLLAGQVDVSGNMPFFFKAGENGEIKCLAGQDSLRTIRNAALPRTFNYENVKEYIFSHLTYPAEAVQKEIEGTVWVSFVIMPQGNIDSIELVQTVHPLLDQEAFRLIREMPLWKPVLLKGKPVSLHYKIPVIFELLPADTTKKNNLRK